MVDGFLVAVTIVSLSMAIIMAVITWRVLRLERKQTAARATIRSRVTRRPQEIAAAPGMPTWPPLRRDMTDPRWSDLEIARAATPRQPAPTRSRPAIATRIERVAAAQPDAPETPETVSPPASNRSGNGRYVIAVGVGTLALTVLLGWMLAFGGSSTTAANLSPAAARVASPLELVALAATRDGERVTVRGAVRNPAAGSRMAQLEAVIFLFNRRGMYVGTTRAVIAHGVLVPGSESPFEIPIAAGLQVSQYRLSFRMTTAPVPHIDRRPAPERRIAPGTIVVTRGCNNHSGSDCFS